MTAYTNHPDAIFEVGKPNIGATHLEARDNLIAFGEGDDTAPKLALKAIERLVAGDSVRARLRGASADPATISTSHGFTQIGSVRVNITNFSGPANSAAHSISRTRGGTTTVISSHSGSLLSYPITIDVDVLPGDRVNIVSTSNGGSTGQVEATIATDGGNLWSGSFSNMTLEGNDV